jgi:succinyl-diaminopimelate desuccinylase
VSKPGDKGLEEALSATTLALCRIPSPTGQEQAIADHLEARLGRRFPASGFNRYGHSLVVFPQPRRPDRPTVALCGHLDTVVPRQDHPVGSDGARIYGSGASDMKGGLAVMLELLERLDLSQLGVNLTAVFYEREEGPYDQNGLQPLLEHLPALQETSLAFCLEPSDNHLQLGCVGGIHCTLVFEGKRAHSARPWQGVNAVHSSGELLVELHQRGPIPVRFGDLTFYEVMSVTMVEGVGAKNVIPDRMAMNLNYRFAPGKSLEAAKQDVESLVRGRCGIEWTDLSPSGPVCLDHPLLAPLRERPGLVVEPKQAWTDVARLALFGIPAVNLGPGEAAQAHQRNESCRIDLLVEGYRLFEAYLRSL